MTGLPTPGCPARGRDRMSAETPRGTGRPSSAGRYAMPGAAFRKAPIPAFLRRETAPFLHIEDESCAGGNDSCRRSMVRADQRTHHNRHHPAADLDPGRNIWVRTVFEADVDDAPPAHLRPLLARDRDALCARHQAVLHGESAERTAG